MFSYYSLYVSLPFTYFYLTVISWKVRFEIRNCEIKVDLYPVINLIET